MRSLILLSLCMLAAAQQGYTLVWSDEFNGNSLDLTKWQYEQNCDGGGNNELQCYTNSGSNVAVTNGNLVVTAIPATGLANGKQYTSGRINTAASVAWKYGRFDIRAQLPNGAYLWPALWMMPRDSVYGWWAASGEIDIMEAQGQLPTITQSTLHHGASWPNNVYTGSGPVDTGINLQAAFHVYTCIWTPDAIQFLVDGNSYYTISLDQNFYGGQGTNPYTAIRQPFDQYFFFIINLAVGGNFFGGNANSLTTQQAQQWANPSLLVDYVRVYQLSNNVVTPPAAVPVSTPAATGSSTLCQTMFSQATCRTSSEDPTQVNANAVAGARGWLCGNYPQYCVNIQNGGQYSSCNSVEQLTNAMSIYYNAFASQGAAACSFGGIAQLNTAAAAAAATTSSTVAAAATSSAASACQTMFSQASCRTASEDPTKVDPNAVAGARGWLCNAYPQYCANIQTGGQYSGCNAVEQLTNAMSIYYNAFKGTQGTSACSFGGLAVLNNAVQNNATPTPSTTSAAAAVAQNSNLQTASYCGSGLYACNGACYQSPQYCCINNNLVQKGQPGC